MTEIDVFIAARLDDDERKVGPYTVNTSSYGDAPFSVMSCEAQVQTPTGVRCCGWLQEVMHADHAGWGSISHGHSVTHATPEQQRELRDIDAKRQIIGMWQDPDQVENCWALDEAGQRYEYADGRDPDEREAQVAAATAIDHVVRLLALRWDDHEDWRAEWTA